MGKVYGGRWETFETLDEGGQSHVYLVTDRTGVYSAPCVLKRIKNGTRRARFVNEVLACTSLHHRNIIQLLDHSALDHDGHIDEKLFLVMPRMADGNLQRRAAVYKDSLDSTLKVGIALASALDHAHNNNIIHRDVKPANILFNAPGHDVVLSDFGICLIRDTPRMTETHEAVGPRAFMAPELEDGGQLDVTPAADVYSLAKVIYFMLSGGTILPRERHRDDKFEICAGKTIRHELLGKFFDRTMCQVDQRIRTMAEVCSELERIANWEPASLGALSAVASTSLARIREQNSRAASIAENNKSVAELEKHQWMQHCARIDDWAREEIHKLVGALRAEGLDVETLGQADKLERKPGAASIVSRVGYQGGPAKGAPIIEHGLRVARGPHGLHHDHCFLVRFYVEEPYIFHSSDPTRHAPRDLKVSMIPYYFGADTWQGYFVPTDRVPGRARNPGGVHGCLSSTYDESNVLRYVSSVSAWPGDISRYATAISSALEIFLDRVARWSEPRSMFSFG